MSPQETGVCEIKWPELTGCPNSHLRPTPTSVLVDTEPGTLPPIPDYTVVGPVTPFTLVGDASSETVASTLQVPPVPPGGLPQTGTTASIGMFATTMIVLGTIARRKARR